MKKWKVLFLLLLISCAGFAQETIKGSVTDKDGKPVVAATITLKGANVSTTSDESGNFTIRARSGQTLIITSIGFEDHELKIGAGGAPILVRLATRSNSLDDVVVVGYGTVKKKDLTGSVSVVNVADAEKNPTHDVAKMLQGQVAGVSVQGSGEPGGYVSIKIRGVSSFDPNGNNANSPLFVVDGVILDAPFDFSVDDIESVQVLKDASATAIYGTRGAPGVIIITTKRGRVGAPRVTWNSYVGLQNVPKKIPVLDRVGYQKSVNAADVNAGLTLAPANDPSSPSYVSTVNTDWQHAALKTGLIQDHNLGVSGG
ncbi:MAG TPA: TonB-dependent receptor plug domain-containing protein, partial [Puia sp.]|nr:TonB-dependent receptor plug domain-containing protein [Puia sp.]